MSSTNLEGGVTTPAPRTIGSSTIEHPRNKKSSLLKKTLAHVAHNSNNSSSELLQVSMLPTSTNETMPVVSTAAHHPLARY